MSKQETVTEQKLELAAAELPGGNENIFLKKNARPAQLKIPREWDAVDPEDYFLEEYTVKIKKDKKTGRVEVQTFGLDKDGQRSGVAFAVEKGTPYAITINQMRACWQALFRHQIVKVLRQRDKKNDASEE